MRLDHVALATRDVSEALAVLVGDFGAPIISGGVYPGFRPLQVFLGDEDGGMKVELLEPSNIEQNDFLERFLTRHGDGPHHLTFKVDDLAATIEHMRAAGYGPVGIDLSDPQWREAFLLPKEAHGTVVQLAESNAPYATPLAEYRAFLEHGVNGEPRWWPDPPARASSTTYLRRVVLRTRSLGAATEFFTGLLGGTALEQGEGWMELGWPGDGLLRVEEHLDADPGVDRLELEGDRPRREVVVAGTRLVIGR
jgi:catechol 2,3-dioxygenase-like lactoylglutathione lyase family enzyme